MRTLYRFFLLLAVGLLTALSGCGEDETPSLATYPDNNFSLVAEDGEGSEITVNATYNNEGILEFDKPVIFTFRFNASPEDAIVTFEPIGEDVEYQIDNSGRLYGCQCYFGYKKYGCFSI